MASSCTASPPPWTPRALGENSLNDHAAQITCPVLVCDAEGDDISASAPQLFESLMCRKQYIHFTAAEGAGDHCEAGARTLFHARAFAWLDGLLSPRPVAEPEPISPSPGPPMA